MNKYTSLELSRKLSAAGCDLESDSRWVKLSDGWFLASKENIDKNLKKHREMGDNMFAINAIAKFYKESYPAYDLIWDICIRFEEQFFNQSFVQGKARTEWMVMMFLQQGKKQEAEALIWKNCLFNPKNK